MTARRTLRALLEQSVERFEEAGLSYGHGTTNALDEAAWLILHALGYPLNELNPHLDEPLDATRWRKARTLVDRRIRTRRPAAYLLKEAWLGPHRFYVDERVIVPRSFIAQLLLKWGRTPFPASRDAVPPDGKWGTSPFSVLDMCTGSGCLAILAALAFAEAQVDAADLSDDALAVARINVASYGLEERVHLVKSDLFAALGGRAYDLVVSNPPYVAEHEVEALPPEVSEYEPRGALVAGPTGDEVLELLLANARDWLVEAGVLVCELAPRQADPMIARALEIGYADAFVRADLAGRPRVLVARAG